MQFPTGGKVRERFFAESVQFRYRQYSLDERRNYETTAPWVFCTLGVFS